MYKNLLNKFRLLSQSIYYDSFWAVFGTLFSKFISFIFSIIVANQLESFLFGEYSFYRSTILNMSILASFGLGYTTNRFISINLKSNLDVVALIIKIIPKYTIRFLLVILFASLIFIISKSYFFVDFEINLLLIITIVFFIIGGYLTIITGIIQGFKFFRFNALVEIFSSLCGIILLFMFRNDLDIYLALIIFCSTLLIKFIFFQNKISYLKSIYIVNDKLVIKNLKRKISDFTIPIFLQEGSYALLNWLFIFLIIDLTNPNQLAYYNVTNQIVAILLFIPSALKGVFLSYLSQKINQQLLIRVFKISILSILIPSIFLFLFKDYLINVYGDSFSDVNNTIIIGLYCGVIMSFGGVTTQILIAQNKNWILLFLKILRDSLIILIFLFLIRFYAGSESAFYSMAFSHTLFLLFSSLITLKLISD